MNLYFFSVMMLVLLACSAFFSASETAIFSLSRIERRRLEEAHPKLSKTVLDLIKRPRGTLITILVGNLAVNVLATALITLITIETWGAEWVGVSLTVFTVILILFGEIMPKSIAVRHNEIFAMATAIPLRILAAVIFPIRVFLRWVSDLILSLLIKDRKEHADHFSEEELRALVKIGEEEGIFDRQERYMLQKVFELGERPVRDIMTPRTQIIGLDLQHDEKSHTEQMRCHHFSHFPVYRETLDNILGVISVQEYLLSERRDLQPILQEPLYVPETKRIDDLLAEFQKKKKNYAVCVDEFGGTAGLVTLEDILEEVFGEFYDEYAKPEHPIRPYGNNEFLVEAKVSLTDFNEHFHSNLEAEEASTLGGLILEKLGEVPERGKVLKLPGFEIQIQEVLRHRMIRLVIVRRLET